MANPWDADPTASPLDVALHVEGVSPQVAAVSRSIYQQESGSGKNTKTSNAGAQGGMQVIPSTFNSVADKGWDISNPVDNARAGVRYVAQMADKAGGDPALTAAGYYGGPGAITKAKQGIAVSDPRNPNAPNTLQYGAQVAARIPQDQPQAQGNPWDNDPVVDGGAPQAPNAAQPAPQAPAPAAAPQQPPQAAPGAPSTPPSSLWDTLSNLDPVQMGQKAGEATRAYLGKLGHQVVTDPLGAVNGAVRGLADGVTFGYADKLAAKADAVTTGSNYDANLAAQRQADTDSGPAFTAGQIGSAALPIGAAAKAVEYVPTASKALRTLTGASVGAGEGAANYLGHNDADVDAGDLALNAGVGAAGGTLAGLVSKATQAQKAATFLRANGGESDAPLATRAWNYLSGNGTDAQVANATRSADVIGGLDGLAKRSTQNGATLGPSDANALAASYTQKAADSVKMMDQGAERTTLLNALDRSKSLNDSDIAALRTSPQGHAVADAIQMRQQAQAMTAAQPASNNPILKVGRMAVNNGMLGFLTPHSAIGGFLTDLAPVRNVVTNLLGGRENRTAGIARALGQSDNAQAFLAHNGVSQASQSAQQLSQMGQQALANRQAGIQAQQQAAQQTAAQTALAKAQAAQQAQSAKNLANSVQIRQQQAASRQAQAGMDQQQAAQQAQSSAGNLTNSVQVRQQQMAARQAQAAQAQQQLAAQAASQQAASAGNLENSVAVRQQQAQARQSAAATAGTQGAAQAQAEQQAQSAALTAAQARQEQYAAQRQAQSSASRQAAQAQAKEAQAAAGGQSIAAGNFGGMDMNKPAAQVLLSHVDHPGIPEVQASLSKLAATNPAMGQKIAQLLTPGAPNLKPTDFYGIQKALQDIHGSRVPPITQAAGTSSPALSEALGNVQNPLAYKAGIAARQNAQKTALATASDPEVKKLIGSMSTASKSSDRADLFNTFMTGKTAEQQIEAKRLAEPLITYGK